MSVTKKKSTTQILELNLFDSNIYTIYEIKELPTYTSLESLNLHSNKITAITNLHTLVHLRELNLSSNCLSKIEGLDSLGSLEVLNLASNKVPSDNYNFNYNITDRSH
jgi:hypothetical protein